MPYLEQKQIYRPNMSTIEHHFHGESDVHTLLEGAAYSASRLIGTRGKSLKKAADMIVNSRQNMTAMLQI